MGLLGVLFALSFCPISAVLFFSNGLGLCLQVESPILLPTLFGVGTALPGVAFAVPVRVGARRLGKRFEAVTRVHRRARRATGTAFILVGVDFTRSHVFGVTAIQVA